MQKRREKSTSASHQVWLHWFSPMHLSNTGWFERWNTMKLVNYKWFLFRRAVHQGAKTSWLKGAIIRYIHLEVGVSSEPFTGGQGRCKLNPELAESKAERLSGSQWTSDLMLFSCFPLYFANREDLDHCCSGNYSHFLREKQRVSCGNIPPHLLPRVIMCPLLMYCRPRLSPHRNSSACLKLINLAEVLPQINSWLL